MLIALKPTLPFQVPLFGRSAAAYFSEDAVSVRVWRRDTLPSGASVLKLKHDAGVEVEGFIPLEPALNRYEGEIR